MNLDPILHKLDDYQRFTPTTAIYPKEFALPYLGLGMCDEAVELDEAVAQTMSTVASTRGLRLAILKELGDVYWYLAQLLLIKEITLGDMYAAALQADANFEGSRDGVGRYIMHVTGKIAGKIKKELRDGKDCRDFLIETVPLLVRALDAMGAGIDAHITEVVSANRVKLEDRRERNVLQGSGDNR